MKLCISSPSTGTSKVYEIEEDRKRQMLHDKKIGEEFEGDFLGDDFIGYRFRIQGGADKQGFPMKPGILVNSRVRLLLKPGVVGFQKWRVNRNGVRRRRTVRGAIVGPDISVLNVMVVAKGERALEGLTDTSHPRMKGPKRASKIRKLFNLSLKDDVRNYVIKRTKKAKEGKRAKKVGPKIQRLLTPGVIMRRLCKKKKIKAKRKESRAERQKYNQITEHREYVRRRRKEVRQERRVQQKVKAYLKSNPKENARYGHLFHQTNFTQRNKKKQAEAKVKKFAKKAGGKAPSKKIIHKKK